MYYFKKDNEARSDSSAEIGDKRMRRMIFLLIAIALLGACSSTRYAAYRVITEPENAHVTYIADGEHMGLSPTKTWWSWNDSGDPIRHYIRVDKTGYESVESSFVIYPKYKTVDEAKEDVKDIFVLLQPTGYGEEVNRTVMITSDPSGTAVYGNQDYLGKTPLEIPVFFPDRSAQLELRFERSGYGTERRVLTVSDNAIHVVLHRLK